MQITATFMDQPAASMAGVRGQKDSASSSLMDDPRALEIDIASGGRGEDELQRTQVGYLFRSSMFFRLCCLV